MSSAHEYRGLETQKANEAIGTLVKAEPLSNTSATGGTSEGLDIVVKEEAKPLERVRINDIENHKKGNSQYEIPYLESDEPSVKAEPNQKQSNEGSTFMARPQQNVSTLAAATSAGKNPGGVIPEMEKPQIEENVNITIYEGSHGNQPYIRETNHDIDSGIGNEQRKRRRDPGGLVDDNADTSGGESALEATNDVGDDSEESFDSNDSKDYCFCRGPSLKDVPMICCDKCDEWYHFVCLGIKEDSIDSGASWFCPKCQGKKFRKLKPTDMFYRYKVKADMRKRQKMLYLQRKLRLDQRKELRRKNGEIVTSSSDDSSDSSGSDANGIRIKSKDSKAMNLKKKMSSTTSKDRKNKTKKRENKKVKKVREKKPRLAFHEEKFRAKVRITLSKAVESVELGKEIEEELSKKFGKMSKEYRAKFRLLVTNINDSRNPKLKINIRSGKIKPAELVGMSGTQLASDELVKAREKTKREMMKDKVINEELAMELNLGIKNRKKTHAPTQSLDDILEKMTTEAPEEPLDKIPKVRICSSCGERVTNKRAKFCPSCGAKMKTQTGTFPDEQKGADKEKPVLVEESPLDVTMLNIVQRAKRKHGLHRDDSVNKKKKKRKSSSSSKSSKKRSSPVIVIQNESKKNKEAIIVPDSPASISSSSSRSKSRKKKQKSKETAISVSTGSLPGGLNIPVWKGNINRQSGPPAAFQITQTNGRPFGKLPFPPNIKVSGRIRIQAATKFFFKVLFHSSKKRLVALTAEPNSPFDLKSCQEFKTFYSGKSRAVIVDLESSGGLSLYLLPNTTQCTRVAEALFSGTDLSSTIMLGVAVLNVKKFPVPISATGPVTATAADSPNNAVEISENSKNEKVLESKQISTRDSPLVRRVPPPPPPRSPKKTVHTRKTNPSSDQFNDTKFDEALGILDKLAEEASIPQNNLIAPPPAKRDFYVPPPKSQKRKPPPPPPRTIEHSKKIPPPPPPRQNITSRIKDSPRNHRLKKPPPPPPRPKSENSLPTVHSNLSNRKRKSDVRDVRLDRMDQPLVFPGSKGTFIGSHNEIQHSDSRKRNFDTRNGRTSEIRDVRDIRDIRNSRDIIDIRDRDFNDGSMHRNRSHDIEAFSRPQSTSAGRGNFRRSPKRFRTTSTIKDKYDSLGHKFDNEKLRHRTNDLHRGRFRPPNHFDDKRIRRPPPPPRRPRR